MANVNEIISILDKINSGSLLSFYVPSLKRELKFKPINAGQQKTLLKSAIDNPVFQTRFIIATYNIINENIIEKTELPNLNIIDGAAILLQYRMSVYGEKLDISSDDILYTVNLNDCVEKFKTIETPIIQAIVNGDISLDIGVPALLDQFFLEKTSREKHLNDADMVKQTANISDTLGEAFIGEISKYIKEVTVTIDGVPQALDYKKLSFDKKHAVLEKLPSILVNKTIAYIANVTGVLRKVLQVNGINIEKNLTSEVEVVIDATLFPIE